MTKKLEWTDRHWAAVQRVIADNGTMPWYAAKYQLNISSSNITMAIADEVIKRNIKLGHVEVVRRGSSRKRGNLYLRLPDRTPHTLTAEEIAELKRRRK